MGHIGCSAVSFSVFVQPRSSGKQGLILSGCVRFSCGSMDPVSTYLRRRAPRCLFWQLEGSPCEVASTMHAVHQNSPRPKLEQEKQSVAFVVGTSVIKRVKANAVFVRTCSGLVWTLERICAHSVFYGKLDYEALHCLQSSRQVSWATEGLMKSMCCSSRRDCPSHCLLRINKEQRPRQPCQHSRQRDAGVSGPRALPRSAVVMKRSRICTR